MRTAVDRRAEKVGMQGMIIKTLAENTAAEGFGSEHGLSLYIETKKYKLLFDVGASGLFLQNARKMGVDIADVDYLILSHGHADHGGGLTAFLQENTKAGVFVHRLAFAQYYALRPGGEMEYIGLDGSLKEKRRIILAADRFFIQQDIEVFSGVAPHQARPAANGGLFMAQDGGMTADLFAHEQNLILHENGKMLLLTGCAHNGIVNILAHVYRLKGRMPDVVIGGFHLSSRSGQDEQPCAVDAIGRYLLDTKAECYTCHCTGPEAYQRLKKVMGAHIHYLSAGSAITV